MAFKIQCGPLVSLKSSIKSKRIVYYGNTSRDKFTDFQVSNINDRKDNTGSQNFKKLALPLSKTTAFTGLEEYAFIPVQPKIDDLFIAVHTEHERN